MTDPLLTIEDATREFRVSPKTIRRRLASGEIPGAYKRPGSRGPEWVMPRDSVTAAGFTPRQVAAPAALPVDPEERVSYWERRAADAEGALRTAGAPVAPARPRRDRRALGWGVTLVAVVVGLLAGLLAFRSDGAADDEVARPASTTSGLLATLLEERTQPGDEVGMMGEPRPDALPEGRRMAPVPRGGWADGAGPRFVVATFDPSSPPATVASLQDSAVLLVRMPEVDRVVEVYDRSGSARAEADDPSGPEVAAPDELDVPVTGTDPDAGEIDAAEDAEPGESADAGAPADVPAPAAPVVEPPELPAVDSQTPEAPRDPVGESSPDGPPASASADRTEVVVAPGDSFWSIAERMVTSQSGEAGDADVAAYWATLVAANADDLVQPGNPNLLHVGQQLTAPPLT